MQPNPFFVGVSLVIVSAVGFGLLPILALYAYQAGASVTTLLFVRFSLASLALLTYAAVKVKEWPATRFQWASLFVLGGVFYTVQSSSYLSSVKYIPASLAALLLYSYPIFVTVLSYLVNKEKLTVLRLLSIGLCSLGTAMILGVSFDAVNFLGVFLALTAAVVYSCYIVLGNSVVAQLSPIVTSAFVSSFASLSLLIIALSTGTLEFRLSLNAWAAMCGIALFSTVIAMFAFFQGLKFIGSTRASIISTAEPLVTVAFAAALWQEKLTLLQMLGGLSVMAGGVFAVLSGTGPQGGKDTVSGKSNEGPVTPAARQ
ncbi:DMT family transporter [Desulforudis sp. 1088]|uniref:DMT family transporter n=1 Tax=unclassified Candidatus Desulforudis TaxID=2635950 RepID=UPI003CE4ADB8